MHVFVCNNCLFATIFSARILKSEVSITKHFWNFRIYFSFLLMIQLNKKRCFADSLCTWRKNRVYLFLQKSQAPVEPRLPLSIARAAWRLAGKRKRELNRNRIKFHKKLPKIRLWFVWAQRLHWWRQWKFLFPQKSQIPDLFLGGVHQVTPPQRTPQHVNN